MLKAVVFDFDGVLMDTEPLHYEAFQELWKPMGMACDWQEYRRVYMGSDDRDALNTAFRRVGREAPSPGVLNDLIRQKADIFSRLMREEERPLLPGVLDLLKGLRAQALPLALCSGALRCDIDPAFDRFGLATLFEAVVTAEDVAHSKPDPESYRRAVDALNAAHPEREIQPADCIAIEDTPAGLASAAGAGLHVLAVTNTHDREELNGADRVVSTLSDINPNDLCEWLS